MSTEVALASLGPDAARIAYPLETAMIKGKMVYPLEKAHFAAQLGHESNFRIRSEDLRYSPQRLLKVFPKYFKTLEHAKQYAYNPEKLGSYVYANRMDNGPEWTGDGYLYRGRGLIQLTGRDMYTEASKAIFGDLRLVKTPDLVLLTEIACETAVWFWNYKNIRPLALADDIVAVTKKVNGGTNGLADRREWLIRTKEAFGVR